MHYPCNVNLAFSSLRVWSQLSDPQSRGRFLNFNPSSKTVRWASYTFPPKVSLSYVSTVCCDLVGDSFSKLSHCGCLIQGGKYQQSPGGHRSVALAGKIFVVSQCWLEVGWHRKGMSFRAWFQLSLGMPSLPDLNSSSILSAKEDLWCFIFYYPIIYNAFYLRSSSFIQNCHKIRHCRLRPVWASHMGWIMPLVIDHASPSWPGREEDKSRTMMDVLQEVKKCWVWRQSYNVRNAKS